MNDNSVLITAFNKAVNTRDMMRLDQMITEDHRFIDSDGSVISGKLVVIRAWSYFFSRYPDYSSG